ncbi:hypothetical protein [Paenibacillus shenyangensis]|uniref:hypothetical protein n=1 Tax=Paenibacillus sp. A9 TaxID=1284352 RepID=UPI001EE749C9|nr:hypothetical protein [Paenibacillus sp. A9]
MLEHNDLLIHGDAVSIDRAVCKIVLFYDNDNHFHAERQEVAWKWDKTNEYGEDPAGEIVVIIQVIVEEISTTKYIKCKK